MPSESIVDIDSLLNPISDENPAGERLDFMLKSQLDQLRIEVNPDDYPEDDPQRPEARPADWAKIIDLTTEALRDKTKDLFLVSRFIEAAIKEHGVGGYRDGLRLMRRLITDCWDRLLPPIEEPDDIELRVGPLNWLDSTESGGFFPTTLRTTPVIFGDKSYSWQDFSLMQKGKGDVTRDEFERACSDTPRDKLQTIKEDLDEAVDELSQLYAACNEKMGQVAPGLTELRGATKEVHTLVKQVLDKFGSASGGETAEAESGGAADSGGGGAGGAAGSRDQIYKQLRAMAGRLRQLEPHSPVPYLVDRAVEMGELPFPLMIKALIRDVGVLSEMDRELGIRRADGDSSPPPASSE